MKKRALLISTLSVGAAVVCLSCSRHPSSGGPSAGATTPTAVRAKDRNPTHRAFSSNGSTRAGLPPAQVPAEARQMAQQYRDVIYPAVKAFSAQYHVLPNSAKISSLRQFMSQPGHDDWQVGVSPRLDGSTISHEVYSHDPPKGPHDPWATNTKFRLVAGPWGRGFIVHGWDDGRVTFDPVNKNFVLNAADDPVQGAPPGAAGIPPSAKQPL